VLIEGVLTFFLVWVVFGTAVDPRGAFGRIAGLGIGFAVAMGLLMGAPFTGGAMNPARSFGPALVNGQWMGAWSTGWTDHRGRRSGADLRHRQLPQEGCGDPGTDQLGEVALPPRTSRCARRGASPFAIPAGGYRECQLPPPLGVLPKNSPSWSSVAAGASKGGRGGVRGRSGQPLGQVAEPGAQDLSGHALDLLGNQDIGGEEEAAIEAACSSADRSPDGVDNASLMRSLYSPVRASRPSFPSSGTAPPRCRIVAGVASDPVQRAGEPMHDWAPAAKSRPAH